MLKTLLAQLRQYKKDCLLAPLCTAGEVLMEVLIPFVTAALIDRGIEAGDMAQVYRYGALMLALAVISLCFGVAAGRFSARASTGFACNLRDAMYANVQTFSFSNIDKFSTAGLVTRMTTDVTNLQNACQMILRIAVRAVLDVHVLFYQRAAEPDLLSGHRSAGRGAFCHHGAHDQDL